MSSHPPAPPCCLLTLTSVVNTVCYRLVKSALLSWLSLAKYSSVAFGVLHTTRVSYTVMASVFSCDLWPVCCCCLFDAECQESRFIFSIWYSIFSKKNICEICITTFLMLLESKFVNSLHKNLTPSGWLVWPLILMLATLLSATVHSGAIFHKIFDTITWHS